VNDNFYVSGIDLSYVRNSCAFQEAHIALEGVEISGNYFGFFLSTTGNPEAGGAKAEVSIRRSTFVGNFVGVLIHPDQSSVQIDIQDSQFLGNNGGITIDNPVKTGVVRIQRNRFIGGDVGVTVAVASAIYVFEPFPNFDDPILIKDNVFLHHNLYGAHIRSANRTIIQGNRFEHNNIGLVMQMASNVLELRDNTITKNQEWGVALWRSPCIEGLPPDPDVVLQLPLSLQGEANEIHDNGKGDLCPEDFNWPPNFVKAPETP